MYKIMIVEDDELISKKLESFLKSWNYSVERVTDFYNVMDALSIPWWRSHPIHENRATESIWTEPCNPLLRATKSTKRATSTY